jgi:ElaB/YqjD/DUF883 family membrane-anchored ribosome-binding protein
VDNELEVIRHQMEEKRASLAEKIDALENQVLDIVHETGDQVTNIVEEVKSGVGEVVNEVKSTVETVVGDVKSTANTLTEGVEKTVESVKETFNVSDHIRQHPWMALSGAFAVGVAGGYLTGGSSERRSEGWQGQGWTEPSLSTLPPRAEQVREPEPEPARDQELESAESTWSLLGDAGKQALDKLKEAAIGTLMGVLGQVVVNALPATLKSDASNIVRDLTTKLGGKVIDVGEWLERDRTEQNRPETGSGGNGAEAGGDRDPWA